MKLSDENVPTRSPNSYDTDEFVNFSTANASPIPLPYVAARINVSETSDQDFVLGSGETTSRRKRRSLPPEYYNGPLQDDQYYRVFLRFFNHEVNKGTFQCLH